MSIELRFQVLDEHNFICRLKIQFPLLRRLNLIAFDKIEIRSFETFA